MPETGKDTIDPKTDCMIQAQIDLLNSLIEDNIRRKWILEEVKRKLSSNSEKGE